MTHIKPEYSPISNYLKIQHNLMSHTSLDVSGFCLCKRVRCLFGSLKQFHYVIRREQMVIVKYTDSAWSDVPAHSRILI